MIRENSKLRLLLRRSPGDRAPEIRKVLPNRLFELNVVDCADELELLLGDTRPDVILLDLTVPSLDNKKSFDVIKERHLPPPIIVFGPKESLSLLLKFIKHGANAMFLLEDDPDVITHAVRQAAEMYRLRRENERLRTALEGRNKTVGILEHLGEAMYSMSAGFST